MDPDGHRGTPLPEGMGQQIRIIESAVAGDLLPQPCRVFEGLIGTAEFNFRHDQRRIVAIELIHLEEALAGRNDITGLVDEAALTKCHQFPGILQRDFLFPLETADSVQ